MDNKENSSTSKKSANQIQSVLEELFKKLPPLPANAVDAVVSITPWLALVFGIIGVLVAVSAFGIFTFLSPLAIMGGAAPQVGLRMISTIGWLVSSILMLIAFPGLKAGKANGWNMLFWSEVVNVVASVLVISIGSILGAAIAFYLLFQIKHKYK